MQEEVPNHLRWLISFLFIALLVAHLYPGEEALKVEGAKFGGVSLQLAADPKEALAVLKAWSPTELQAGRISEARIQIYWDFLLIALYAYGLFWAIRAAAFVFDPPNDDRVRKLAWAPIAAALLDAFPENFGMLWMLYQPGDLPSIWVSGAVAVAAWLKWLLLILVFLLLLGAVIVGMLRARRLDAKHLAESSENPPQAVSPGYLLHLELDHISRNRPKHIVPRSQTDSPHDDRAAWQRAYESDLFGLALSGGGIRSATFALGVFVPPPIVWTRCCNSGRLSHGVSPADFNG